MSVISSLKNHICTLVLGERGVYRLKAYVQVQGAEGWSEMKKSERSYFMDNTL